MESRRGKLNDTNVKDIYDIKDKAFFGLTSNLKQVNKNDLGWHFYTLTMISLKKDNPIYNSIKTKKYIEINLTNKVNELYDKIFKTWMKKLRKMQINGRIFCVYGHGESILLKYS